MITSLVEEPQSTEVLDITPRCCHSESRIAAYNLIVVLCDECVVNLQLVADRLVAMHHSERLKTAKEWEVSCLQHKRGYMEIFEGHKIHGFCCKLAEREILNLEKKQWLKEMMNST